ncbi:hypothetical protein DYB37_006755 [Aphanomyces astaci]|uniref:Uncharacterized protein n=1 Tax=Aphanomyces astaci TaxID=112090 RepID=A0A3R7CCJ6_APHAT|nr:hypothetical protein DYB37_006755 [Aphanomyces astaci]
MYGLIERIERKLTLTLPDKLTLVFDGWTYRSTHYVALFASFPSDDPIGYSRELLAFAPINDEDYLSAAAHSEFESFVLELYGKSWKNVVALIGDNCSTNVAFARLAGLPLVVCDSHRFNLVVSDLLSNHDVVIQKVNILMRKLRNILPAARLRRLTPLRAKTLNATRWTSAFSLTR